MFTKTRISIVAALVLILAVVGVAAAQSDTPKNPANTGESAGAFPWKDRALGLRCFRINAITEALGMTVEELKAELSSGKTVAELAEEKGVDLQKMAVDQATEMLQQAVDNGRLTQGKADQKLAHLQERIASGEGFKRPNKGEHLAGLAETLGMTVEELQAAIEEGKTPKEIAEAQGIDLQQLAVDKVTEKLQQAVDSGRLTKDEADQKLAEIQAKIESGEGTFFKPCDRSKGRFGGFGSFGPAE